MHQLEPAPVLIMILLHRNYVIFAICGVALLTLIISHPAAIPFQQRSRRKVHLLLPVDEKAAREGSAFCKTLLSALVHGYEPIILNWHLGLDFESMQRIK